MNSDLCSLEPDREVPAGNIRIFVRDRNIRSLHLPRRMGIDSAAYNLKRVAEEEEGIAVSVYPDTSGDMVICPGEDRTIPGKDAISIKYLCHQTLAVFRA